MRGLALGLLGATLAAGEGCVDPEREAARKDLICKDAPREWPANEQLALEQARVFVALGEFGCNGKNPNVKVCRAVEDYRVALDGELNPVTHQSFDVGVARAFLRQRLAVYCGDASTESTPVAVR